MLIAGKVAVPLGGAAAMVSVCIGVLLLLSVRLCLLSAMNNIHNRVESV